MSPLLEVIWRDTNYNGLIRQKTIPWHGPTRDRDLSDYMANYFEMLDSGYMPIGFNLPPRPHCARILRNGKVLAEWFQSPTRQAESLVTADTPLGSGGIPTATPSAPCSERLAVPTRSDPCSMEIQSETAAISRTPSDSIRDFSPRTR